jgi:hypothetical protein
MQNMINQNIDSIGKKIQKGKGQQGKQVNKGQTDVVKKGL